MQRVTGFGGIFFKANDPVALGEWYRKHLGIDVQPWGKATFSWSSPENLHGTGTTTWSLFKHDTGYLAPSQASFMINYRVDHLHALWAALRAEGCQVEDEVVESEYGKFDRVLAPKGQQAGTLATAPRALTSATSDLRARRLIPIKHEKRT